MDSILKSHETKKLSSPSVIFFQRLTETNSLPDICDVRCKGGSSFGMRVVVVGAAQAPKYLHPRGSFTVRPVKIIIHEG